MLLWGVSQNYTCVFKYLLRNFKSCIDIREKVVLLRRAVANNNCNLVKFLFENFRFTKSEIEDLLDVAAKRGNINILQLFQGYGADVCADKNIALRVALKYDRNSIAKWLVENGADVSVLDNYPIQIATLHGNLQMVKFLHEHGADISALNYTTLKNAVVTKSFNVIDYIIKNADVNDANFCKAVDSIKKEYATFNKSIAYLDMLLQKKRKMA